MRLRPATRTHVAVGLAQLVAWGALHYTWPLIVVPMVEETGWGTLVLSAAFSGGLLLAGLLAPSVGRLIDGWGGRPVMVAGGLLAVGGLVAWTAAPTQAAYVAAQLALGAACAATLYDAAFATLGQLHRSSAAVSRGIWRVSLLGALAGPAAAVGVGALVASVGWRAALLGVALATLLLVVLPLALGLPAGRTLSATVGRREPPRPARPHGHRLGLAFALAALGASALQAHLVPIVLAAGGSWERATGSLAVLTGVKLPARVAIRPFVAGLGDARFARGLFLLQAAGLGLLSAFADGWGWWAGIVTFGCADALTTPVRAATVRGEGGRAGYGRRLGRTALWTSLGRAAGSRVYRNAQGQERRDHIIITAERVAWNETPAISVSLVDAGSNAYDDTAMRVQTRVFAEDDHRLLLYLAPASGSARDYIIAHTDGTARATLVRAETGEADVQRDKFPVPQLGAPGLWLLGSTPLRADQRVAFANAQVPAPSNMLGANPVVAHGKETVDAGPLGRIEAQQPVVIIERPALRAPRPQILGGATQA